ncbi:MAG: TatD family hydrolase [Hymenobacteraceae bacterium]|nr:TatD family hydrolase [Hymenobacteraceae bacterium]MDX5394639.1 TatD family hydrolase [Hymenobacteraceae bacterium]MDX5442166.1 TatD family hydrolase [Hymenobacteraceae bacterium]MDX5510670.1 TatD family hydrolase [Hymenobacteraceae bacterium]
MEFIDTHSHIFAEQFKEDRDEALQRAFAAGVSKILMPNIDHASIDAMMQTEADYPQQCFAMMGLHPCSVTKSFAKELYLVEDWLSKRSFAAIGETGIDLYWDKTHLEQQKEALRIQVGWAKHYKLPIVLHTRDSFSETYDLLKPEQDGSLTGVFHCFSGTIEEAQQAIELGFYLGIGGVATFKNGGLDKVLPHIDLKHLVLETDSPYLAPVPHRGKRNESAYLPLIAQKVAELKEVDIAEVAAVTTQNAQNLFRIQ